MFSLTQPQRYAIALGGVALAAMLRMILDPLLAEDLPFMLFLFPIVLACWAGGLGPGLVATGVSLLLGDFLFLPPRGEIFQFETQLSTTRAGAFAVTGVMLSILFDRFRKAVKAQLDCLEHFGLLIESVKDYAIFTLDPCGRVDCWNTGAERIEGYREAEVVGKHVSLFYPPEDVKAGRPRTDLDVAVNQGHFLEEGWHTRRDGTRFWASGVIVPLLDDRRQLRGYAKIIRDMTAEKLAQQQVEESRRFAQHIVDVSPGVIWIYDVTRKKTVFVNRSLAPALGHKIAPDHDEVRFFGSIIHEKDLQIFLEHYERMAQLSDEQTDEVEFRMRHADDYWRWFHTRFKVFARNEDGTVKEVMGLTTDITQRKAVEDKAMFMSELNQALLPLADPEEILAVTVRMLGQHLDVDGCGYGEVDAEQNRFVILGEYTRSGVRRPSWSYELSDFTETERRILAAGEPYVINDIETELLPGLNIDRYRREGLRAVLSVPLNKRSDFAARMAVFQKTPRRWSEQEIYLVTVVANRCWESVERARANRLLRESDQRYRAFIANTSEGIWRVEMEEPIPSGLPEDEQIEMVFRYAYLAECNDAMARMYGYRTADEIVGARLSDLMAPSDPQNLAMLKAFKRAGYCLTNVETCELDRFGNVNYFLNSLTGIEENGAIVRAWGTQREITEQKRVQEALRSSEERLHRITDATQDALWEIDLKTNLLWWSEGAKPLFGHSPGELQIGLEDWYRGIHPDDVNRVRMKFEQFMHNRDSDWTDEYRFRGADGAYIDIQDKGRKFYDENGVAVRVAGAMVDITKRKRAEQALRESEERYRLLTDLSPDGVVIADGDGNIHLANTSLARMLDVPVENLAGRNLFDFVKPDLVERARSEMLKLMTTGIPATHVESAFQVDSRIIPVEVMAVRLDWKGQRFAQIVIHDISGRKQAEAERERLSGQIEAERNRLRQILEQMPIGVSIGEAPSGRPVFHNIEAVRLLRHPLKAANDYGAYAQYGALHPDGAAYRPEEYPAARSVISGEIVKAEEMRYRRGDGTETFFSVDSAPIYDVDGRMVLTITTFIDIAARKRAEEALRESEERFAKAFKASPDALLISRVSDGMIIELNDTFANLSGYSREELIGKTTLDMNLFVDPAVRDRAVRMLKEQNYIRDFEFAMKRKSGDTRLFSMSAEPLDLRGEHCWLTLGRDITERRRVEEERERLLQKEKAAREDAEAASRMKDEFLATISHELRTPLTSILGWSRMLTSGSLSDAQTRRALQVIEQSALSQTRLVDDILDTSRIITGRLKLDAHPVEIDRVFQAAIDVIRPSAEAKRIAFRSLIMNHGSMVLGDSNRLQQVIWNLLSNAVKFTNEGGSVEARLNRIGDQIEISVTDTGMGIEPEFLPYVFDRFRQADSTSTRRFGGLGLGLAIVRHVVEMHGGSVSATSPGKGKGSTFKVRFPVATAGQLPQPQPRPKPSEVKEATERLTADHHKLDGLNILVVEDDPDTLEMLRFILDDCGARVITAGSTNEALRAFELWRPDVLVSDLAMPGEDGYDLIRQIRARGPERGGNIPAVALTAYARAEDRIRALAAGFQLHVTKPVDPDELITVVVNLKGLAQL